MIVCCLVATSLTWHLVLGLANSKGEGGLTLSLFMVGDHIANCNMATQVPVIVALRRCGWSFDW